MGLHRNKGRNERLSRVHGKWICNMHNLMEHKENESGAKRKFTAQNAYVKKLENSHAGNLTACFKGYNKKKWGSKENEEETSRNFQVGGWNW